MIFNHPVILYLLSTLKVILSIPHDFAHFRHVRTCDLLYLPHNHHFLSANCLQSGIFYLKKRESNVSARTGVLHDVLLSLVELASMHRKDLLYVALDRIVFETNSIGAVSDEISAMVTIIQFFAVSRSPGTCNRLQR